MIESDRDHETVLEVLAAFVRERTSTPQIDDPADLHHTGDDHPLPATDVQAALTVLGRRPRRPERNTVDLAGADLCGYNLSQLNLEHVSMAQTKLQHTAMMKTHLKSAYLAWAQMQNTVATFADLQHAELVGTHLEKAWLIGTDLQRANLSHADLRGAYLAGAKFHGANLNETQLQGADLVSWPAPEFSTTPAPPAISGLTIEQLATAKIDQTTRLPEELRALLNARKNQHPT